MEIHEERSGEGISRRGFLASASVSAAAVAALAGLSRDAEAFESATVQPETNDDEAAAISTEDIAAVERVMALGFRAGDREAVAASATRQRDGFERRRASTDLDRHPSEVFRVLGEPEIGNALDAGRGVVAPTMASAGSPVSPPDDDEDLAFAPAWKQADWIRTRRLTSERLTRVYLDRIERLGPRLECVVTATPELAIEQARRADRDLANGRYRGPLHGLPYGAKDLFDTAGISTTYGAEPYRERVPERTAVVIERLERAGAVLACKTTLGALAYGDIWFGGRTRNPFDLSQGSSGSSAGSSSGVVAGLFSFSLGTETLGSIVSPSMRCGAAGIRPTFGRVARTDSMELCWSLDKIGPICRTIADAALVLSVINGADAGDPSSVDAPFDCDLTRDAYGLRVGYRPEWFEGRGATEHDTAALAAVRDAGCELVEIDYEYQENFGALRTILNVEAAAAFEELTLSGRDEMLKWQQPQAWPNTFRSAWMVPAIELIQAQRIRRAACEYWDDQLARHGVDAVVAPSFAAGLLLLTNFTGTPCAVVRTGFRSETRPHGITVWGRSFGEAAAVKVAHEIERRLGAWETRPPIS